jgi:hypothetical protein
VVLTSSPGVCAAKLTKFVLKSGDLLCSGVGSGIGCGSGCGGCSGGGGGCSGGGGGHFAKFVL